MINSHTYEIKNKTKTNKQTKNPVKCIFQHILYEYHQLKNRENLYVVEYFIYTRFADIFTNNINKYNVGFSNDKLCKLHCHREKIGIFFSIWVQKRKNAHHVCKKSELGRESQG
jgi:hypothetical protein